MAKKKVKSNKPPGKPFTDPATLKKLKYLLATIIAVLAFLLYANTIGHDYTLDDHPAIDENKVTTLGIAGIPTLLKTDYWYGYKEELRGPVYRPTSLIMFAVVWQFIPNNPHINHFLNVVVYMITCVLLFLVLCGLFQNYSLIIPFVCALLYTAHPIHTEVVNNIKSMDEMLWFLFALASIWFVLKHLSNKSTMALILAGTSFFLSLLSKETGITFLAIVPLSIYFFTDAPNKKNLTVSGIFLAITALYLLVRMVVLKDVHQDTVTINALNNTLHAAPDAVRRYATVFYILLRYVILLIFPHPLTCDYNFSQIKIQELHDVGAFLGIALFVGLSVLSLFHFRKNNFLVYGFLFFLITLAPVSNFFFLGGSTMAERFLYMPSLGFCIVLTYLLVYFTKTEKFKNHFKTLPQLFSSNVLLFSIVVPIVLLYSLKTIIRNGDWKDNLTIFSHDVITSDKSATAHQITGSELFQSVSEAPNGKGKTDTLQLAKSHLLKALEIFPYYRGPSSLLGIIYYLENKFDSSVYYQKKELEYQKKDPELYYNYGKTLNKLLRYDEAIQASNEALALDPDHDGAHYNLALAYTNQGDMDRGLHYFSRVIAINPNRGDAYYFSGLIFRAKGDEAKATEYINKAAALGFIP